MYRIAKPEIAKEKTAVVSTPEEERAALLAVIMQVNVSVLKDDPSDCSVDVEWSFEDVETSVTLAYPPIESREQRNRYEDVFDSQFKLYLEQHKIVKSVTQRFAQLGTEL